MKISSRTMWILLCTTLFLYNSAALARECKSCQQHRSGGSVSYGKHYVPGGVYQPGGNYYPGGVYPSYPGYYGGNRYNGYYGSGTITQTCRSNGDCVTRYRGSADNIQDLPRINRHIRQSYPRSYNNPWDRPVAVPLK